MNSIAATKVYTGAPRIVASGQWHRRVFRGGDVAGAITALIPAMLFANAVTGVGAVEVGMYFVGLFAVLPCLPSFITSVHRSAASLLLVLLFLALTWSTASAFYVQPSVEVWLRAKALAATAVWASIYIVVFVAIRTPNEANLLIRWVDGICLAISASVWAGALLHLAGVSFGEIIGQAESTFRAFGPLGDQVGFVVVLPALMSLVAGRPFLFGFHSSAIVLTGTRGALVCLMIGVCAHLLLVARRRRGRHLRQLMSILAIGALLWFTPVSAALKQRFLSPSMRAESIQAGINVVAKSPLVGFGFNGLDANRAAVAEDWTMSVQAANGLSRASNQYVQTAVDGGVVALLLLVLFVGCGIRNSLRVMRWSGASPQLVGSMLWLISIFVGNQASLWVLSDTSTGFFTFAIAGLAAKTSDLARRE
jgi:O-antigen ligase